ncbi:non-structural maintenance of chromosomes element 3 homolog [Thrips palmi]|uniref:Non-structural maintenance of chromosomes element 3 homolog n=1 Tax=Thrips palmi TaxID=161013 RepID=A0A6P8ZIQ9_THRPL|nr:non-structural maintenance of chromosomes element 3 homolog [Thrips palmi]XP_034234034.1 non-structural maintenance of chromosomes element 3 homolog [Thrips palmi]XP_034234035.1 non-structural maintenance of chromosomes element 3 homolog [Thrips palmi]
MSQRMSSQGPARSQAPPISSKELTDLARRAVRYLLMNDLDKVPIKHNDILKNVTKNCTKNTSQVMQLAAKMLRETYGIELVDDGNKPNKHYLLVNCLKHQDHISHSIATEKELALLAIILSLIFMQTNGRWKEAGVEQGKLYAFLKLLDIDPLDHHEYFGDVKKLLESLRSQRYIQEIKIENTDPVKYECRWGLRACEELSPRSALEFASEMYGRDRIETWATQYKAVCTHENGGNVAHRSN